MYTLVISSYWYIMHSVLLLLGVKPSIFFIFQLVIYKCFYEKKIIFPSGCLNSYVYISTNRKSTVIDIMLLQSENHSDQVLTALQDKNDIDILIIGNDGVTTHTSMLWVFSSLIRSLIDSLGNISETAVILPDFSYDDINTCLEMIEGNRRKVLLFNSTTKHLLEVLGIDLRNAWIVGEDDNDEDDIQKMLLLAHNPDFDSSSSDDEDETKQDDVTVDGLGPSYRIKVEKTDVTDDSTKINKRAATEKKYDDDDEIQDILIKDQDLSDSDDDSHEGMIIPGQNDNSLEIAKMLNVFLENKLQDSTKNERFGLHQQKLQEVEQLLIKENGFWKCKECRRRFHKKSKLRLHAELHVKGLSYSCDECNQNFPSKSKLSGHKQRSHRVIVEKDRHHLISNQRFQLKKLQEVDNLVIKEKKDWKCKQCSKIFLTRKLLRLHAELHVTGLSFLCSRSPECQENFTTRRRLWRHQREKHKDSTGKNSVVEINNSDIHQQKLKTIEKLLIPEKNLWKCKECKRCFLKRIGLLHHVETHVSGLSWQW